MYLPLDQRLLASRTVTLCAVSHGHSQMQWHHQAQGQVEVECDGDYIVFHERFTLDNGSIGHDEKRWHWQAPLLHFERKREGRFQEIFCFCQSAGQFTLQQPHHCGRDVYSAELNVSEDCIDLRIQIYGPKKQESLHYCYRAFTR